MDPKKIIEELLNKAEKEGLSQELVDQLMNRVVYGSDQDPFKQAWEEAYELHHIEVEEQKKPH